MNCSSRNMSTSEGRKLRASSASPIRNLPRSNENSVAKAPPKECPVTYLREDRRRRRKTLSRVADRVLSSTGSGALVCVHEINKCKRAHPTLLMRLQSPIRNLFLYIHAPGGRGSGRIRAEQDLESLQQSGLYGLVRRQKPRMHEHRTGFVSVGGESDRRLHQLYVCQQILKLDLLSSAECNYDPSLWQVGEETGLKNRANRSRLHITSSQRQSKMSPVCPFLYFRQSRLGACSETASGRAD